MIKLLSMLFIFTTTGICFAQNEVNVINGNLSMLTGNKWLGRLTYLDYTSGKKISISAELTVVRPDSTGNLWLFNNKYPDDPGANSTDSVKVSFDGSMIKDETVKSILFLGESTSQIITEKMILDNDTEKIIRYTYTISPKSFTIKKEERNEDNIVFIQKSNFEYTR